jgi:hypothetical protein
MRAIYLLTVCSLFFLIVEGQTNFDPAWNETLHHKLLWLCSAALCPQPQIQNWSCKNCQGSNPLIKDLMYNETTNIFAFTAVDISEKQSIYNNINPSYFNIQRNCGFQFDQLVNGFELG